MRRNNNMKDIRAEKPKRLDLKHILKYITLVIVGLQILSFCFPWFTFDGNIMGYYHGYSLLVYTFAPFMFILIYYILNLEGIWSKFLIELSLLNIIAVIVHAFRTWEITMNIRNSFRLVDSVVAAQPAFWYCCLLSLLSIILFQPQLVLRD
jgi:hypothetical protein